MSRIQDWIKLRLTVGQEIDFKPTFLTFVECGAGDLDLFPACIRILDLQWSTASCLDTMMEVSACRDSISAEARARIIHFYE